jgi:uncharacterized cupin superfamily protein
MPRIEIAKIPTQQIASYPKEFAHVISGREKQRIGDAAGLTQFGVNVTRIKAGSASALRHWHEQEDEFIYMLEGELVLQENDGETVLKPGDAAGFKAGSGIAHCLFNRTQRDAVYLEVGTRKERARALSRRRFLDGARRNRPPLFPQIGRADRELSRYPAHQLIPMSTAAGRWLETMHAF